MTVAGDSLIFSDGFEALFHAQGLRAFESIVQPPGCEVLRMIPERANLKFRLADGDRSRTFYLKVHPRQPARWLTWGQPERSPGMQEFDSAVRVRSLGLPCYTPVAAGEGESGSFFISEDIYGGYQLDHYLDRHCDDPRKVASLVVPLAELAAAFHLAGFAHKDFYLCHFFYTPTSGELRLIDLQRMVAHEHLPLRARVKDLGALYYSWGQSGKFTEEHWRAFLDHYLRRARPDIDAVRLMKKITAKTRRIRRHDEKSKARTPLPVIEDDRE